MSDPGLPAALAAALSELAEGKSRLDLGRSARQISAGYRRTGTSSDNIRNEEGALAYAMSRMPATYAAIADVLGRVQEVTPDFLPASILDAGAGPGTASWAALAVWPALGEIFQVDHNPALLEIGAALAGADAPLALQAARRARGDLRGAAARTADLVVAGYALTEVADAELVEAALSLWSATEGTLVIVEPGTPRDYARLMTVRVALIAAGARVLAPCPHEQACPLVAPDWCHFAVRLPRRRDHMRLKAGVVPYEDEKFSYLAVSRADARRTASRVIKPPRETKFDVGLEICSATGIETRTVRKRDRDQFRQARRLRWGDGLMDGLRDENLQPDEGNE